MTTKKIIGYILLYGALLAEIVWIIAACNWVELIVLALSLIGCTGFVYLIYWLFKD